MARRNDPVSPQRPPTPPPGPPALVLASASPRRGELLPRLGLPFEIVPPVGVDEDAVTGSAEEVATTLARVKAQSVLSRLVGSSALPRERWLVLGADTVVAVEVDGREVLLGKPADAADARRMLSLLAGRTHSVLTGVALARSGVPLEVRAERSEVAFRRLSVDEIDDYVQSGDPFGKAGAYGIQSQGGRLVGGVHGCYYNIVGLPLGLVARLLAPWGARLDCDCAAHALQRGQAGCGVTFGEGPRTGSG